MSDTADVDVARQNSSQSHNPQLHSLPVQVSAYCHTSPEFRFLPIFGPLIFENAESEARDHCANERTFLSYIRLSIYLMLMSVAITISFNFKDYSTPFELQMAKPLGYIFCCLSFMSFGLGLGTYMKTMTKYSQKTRTVQNGWITQSILTIIAASICGVCILFLGTRAKVQTF